MSSIGHFYLAQRAYKLKSGASSHNAICNISEKINCDSALLSPYAEVFGMSLSNFGLAFNLFLSFSLFFFLLFGGTTYWKNISFYLSVGIALSSVAMAIISSVNALLCPVCWALYVFSFVVVVLLFFAFRPELSEPISFIWRNAREKSLYAFTAGLAFLSLFFHIYFVNAFDIKDQEELVSAVFIDWQNAKPLVISSDYIMEKGAKNPKMTVVEFADFLCPACKEVQPALEHFLKNAPEAKLQFYVYPLDGTCNPSVEFVKTGLSCELSQALVCAQKQNKAWLAHDFLFENQKFFLKKQGDKNHIENLFQKMFVELGLDKKAFQLCMKEPSFRKKLLSSTQAVGENRVQGTPAFFVNGKPVQQFSSKLLILRKIYRHLQKEP